MIASILLPLDRPELTGRSLVRCCELFGIAEGTTRVALSRMVARHELEQTDGRYRLTGPMLERQARQRAARWPKLRPWSGSWLVAVVVAERRGAAERATLRGVLRHHRMAELREGVWARPDNVDGMVMALAAPGAGTTVDPVVSARGTAAPVTGGMAAPGGEGAEGGELAITGERGSVIGHCLWLRAVPAADLGAPDDRGLARRLWDLDLWASQARSLLADLDRTLPRLQAEDTSALAPCFAVAAAAVRHVTADPLLPGELLPGRWPADELRSRYEMYEHAYGTLLASWLGGASPAGGTGADAGT
ncbi:MAG: PaaX domain-containing protein, C- domain protein [Actinomycetota bacterium]|nr:PaaX domain-containing protein, C- domain protein [Actinomycetota bacterium]MDA8280608.1 PaaX domain-containing protein, C- domain protein [Actinomycetota bacterium]